MHSGKGNRRKPVRVDSARIAMICAEHFGSAASAAGYSSVASSFGKLKGALRAKDGQRALTVATEPCLEVHDTAEQFFAAQLGALVKRLQLPGFDPEAAARRRWETAEWRCKWVNRRLAAWERREWAQRPFRQHVDRMRQYIRAVLGDQPNLDQIFDLCRFGPGTSVGVHGDSTHLFAKLASEGKWGVTRSCSNYAAGALSRILGVHELLGLSKDGLVCFDPEGFWQAFVERSCTDDQHDSVLFVPKNSRTHRAIGQPVTLNSFVQLGTGDWIFDRLYYFGVDLSSQRLNQRLAQRGSLPDRHRDGRWATIDLEMASDTIARAVVRLLLPREWYLFLDRLRVHTYRIGDGPVREYHKFSAMGNGFTFPLETLLFAAACHAVTGGTAPHDFSVYGDDIIVRQGWALELIELLRFLGFRTNVDKTFVHGDFRESCGEDYVAGSNIRPAFVKGESYDSLQLIGLHNRVMESPFFVPSGLLPQLRALAPHLPIRP